MSPPVFVDQETAALRAEFRNLLRRDAGDAVRSVEKALIEMGDASFVSAKRSQMDAKRSQMDAEKALFGDLAKTNLGRVFGVAANAQSILGNAMDVFKTDAFEAITGVEKARTEEGEVKNTFLSRILGADKYLPGDRASDPSPPGRDTDRTTERESKETVESTNSTDVRDVRVVDDVRVIEGEADEEVVGLLDEIRDGIIDLIGAVQGAEAADDVRARMDARRSTEASRERKRSAVGSVVSGGKSPVPVGGGFADEVVGEVIGSAIGSAAGGGLAGLAARAMNFGAVATKIGARALPVVGSVLALGLDAFSGYDMAEEWDTSKVSGVLGTILGGTDEGMKGAFAGAGKWGLTGAAIGSVVPVVGTLAGGLVGAAIGAVLGFVGGENIARMFDGLADSVSGLAGDLKDGIADGLDRLVDRVGGWITENVTDPLGMLADEAFGTSFVLDEESLSVEVDALTRRMAERETEIARTSRSLNESREAMIDAVSRGDETMIAVLDERISRETARLEVLRTSTEEDSARLDVAGERLSSSRRKWVDVAGEWADRTLIEPVGRLVDNVFGTSTVLDEESLRSELAETRARVSEREAVWEERRHALAVVVRDMVAARDSGDVALIASLEARERTMRSSFEDMARAQHRDEERIVALDEMVSESTSKVIHRVGNWIDLNVGGVLASVADGLLGTELSTDEQDARMAELGASVVSTVGGLRDRVVEALTFEFPEIPGFEMPDLGAVWDDVRSKFAGLVEFDPKTLAATPTVASLALLAAGGIGTFFGDNLGFDSSIVPDIGLAEMVGTMTESLAGWLDGETTFDASLIPSIGLLGMATSALGGLESLFRGATTFELPEVPDIGGMARNAAESIGSIFGDMDLDFDAMFAGAVSGIVGFRENVVGGLGGFVTRVSDFVGRIFSWDYWFGDSDPGDGARTSVVRAREEEERRARLVTSLDDSATGVSDRLDEALERFRRGEIGETEIETIVREIRSASSDEDVIEDLGEALRAFEETRVSRSMGDEAVERRTEFVDDLRGSIDSLGFDSDSESVVSAIRDFEIGATDLSDTRDRLVEIESSSTDRNERWEAKEALSLFGAYEAFEREARATMEAEGRSTVREGDSREVRETERFSEFGGDSEISESVGRFSDSLIELSNSGMLTDRGVRIVESHSTGEIDRETMMEALSESDARLVVAATAGGDSPDPLSESLASVISGETRRIDRNSLVERVSSDERLDRGAKDSVERFLGGDRSALESLSSDEMSVVREIAGVIRTSSTDSVVLERALSENHGSFSVGDSAEGFMVPVPPEAGFEIAPVFSVESDPTRLGEGNRVDEETRASERERMISQAMVVNSRTENRVTNSRTSVTIPASVHNDERTFAGGASGVY